jgi:hypothetical protein
MEDHKIPSKNEPSESKPYVVEDQKQRIIYDRLKRLVGPGAAAFFKDACRIMNSDEPFDATINLVAHLLREIESMMSDVLQGSKESKQCETCGRPMSALSHREKIQIILDSLGFSESEKIRELWLSVPGKRGLQSYAHRNALKAPRLVDESFLDFWERMQMIIYTVLESFEKQYIKVFRLLDELLEIDTPSKEDIKKLLNNVPNNYVSHSYFFRKLRSSKWLKALSQSGIFEVVQARKWPAGIYLEAIASLEPDIVTQILLDFKETDDSRIKGHLLTIVSHLTSEKKIILFEKIKVWIISTDDQSQFYLTEPGKLIISQLLDSHNENESIELIKIFLEILPDPKPIPAGYVHFRDPNVRLDKTQYSDFVREISKRLADIDDGRAFNLFCDLLDEYLKKKHDGREINDEYYQDYTSHVWRQTVEGEGYHNDVEEIENSLISAIRDLGLSIIQKNPTELPNLLKNLESRKWGLLKRICLFLVSERPGEATNFLSKYLLELGDFDDINIKQEYRRLIRNGYGNLNSTDQTTILDWIDGAQQVRERAEASLKLKTEEKVVCVEKWQLDKLSQIEEHLPPEWNTRYQSLISKYGKPEPELLETTRPIGVWVNAVSSTQSLELTEMNIEDISNLLEEKISDEEHPFTNPKEGLVREFQSAIKLKPEHFENLAIELPGKDPVFISAYFQAYKDVMQNGYTPKWDLILDLGTWVVKEPQVSNQDHDYVQLRKAVLSAISHGLNLDNIPYECKEKVWLVIEALSSDPDPQSRSDEEEIKREPYSDAINSVRGQAIEAVIEYALWRYRTENLAASALKNCFEMMPEVKDVLDWHANASNDSSLAIRSIYGKSFPFLVLLDPKWTQEKLDLIMKSGQLENRKYFSVWFAYMLYARAYNNVFSILKPYYHEAVRKIGKIPNSKIRHIDLNERLADHLMLFYGRGEMRIDDGILVDFWSNADEKLRGHALDFIGRGLKNDEPADPEAIERLRNLWEARLKNAQSSEDKSLVEDEMSAFAWWFASGKFEEKWSCDQFLIAPEYGRLTQADSFVVERLLESVKTLPLESIRILSKLVLTNPGWVVLAHREQVKDILSIALHSPEKTANKEAQELISIMLSRDIGDFSELLSKN